MVSLTEDCLQEAGLVSAGCWVDVKIPNHAKLPNHAHHDTLFAR